MLIPAGGMTWDYGEPFVLSFCVNNSYNENRQMAIILDGIQIFHDVYWVNDRGSTLGPLAEYVAIFDPNNSALVCIFPVYSSITMTPNPNASIKNVRVHKYVEA